MPYVNVHVDWQDVLDDMDDDALERELEKRRQRQGKRSTAAEPWTPLGMAEDLRTAFYARDASRFEALLATLDPASRTPGLTAAPIAALPGMDARQ
jgi:hypothetical protein